MTPGSPSGPGVWTEILRRSEDAPPLLPAQDAFLDRCWYAVWRRGPWGPRGVAGLIGCGHGKTLCAQLAPRVLGARRPLLVLPAAMRDATAQYVADWSRWYPLADPPVVTYEWLSTAGAAHALEQRRPDLLVLDEAHLLANGDSARWRRMSRYLAHHPEVRVVLLSGTLAWSEIGQAAHLLHAALRDANPLPVWSWPHLAAVADVGGSPGSDDWTVLDRVVGPVPARTKDAARAAIHGALAAAPGAVLVAGLSADVSLTLAASPAGDPPESAAALQRLRSAWELPDGTQLVDALEHHRHARSLALGWWGRWREGTARPEWRDARAAWAEVVKRALVYGAWGAGHLDSPAQVADAADRGALGPAAGATWARWVAERVQPPEAEVVWLPGGEQIARRAVDTWSLDPAGGLHGGVVWYASRAIGDLLATLRPRPHGTPLQVRGAGSPPPDARHAAASWRVHGKGWNGQQYHRALVLEPPSSAGEWEQLLARHHRPGQRRDVHVDLHVPTGEGRDALRAALAGARFAHTTLGAPQRLLAATWTRGL